MKQIIRKILRKSPYAKESYSQCGEDLIINFIFNSIGIQTPSFIDIGAHHPEYLNNTAFFYRRGASGINIEPDPTLFKAFEKMRGRDVNINAGIASSEGSFDFYVMSSPTLNTFSKDEAHNAEKEGYKIVDVKKIGTVSLQTVLNKYAGGRFPDFLSLDVEGIDLEILQAIEYEKTAPTVICVETISFSNTGQGVKNATIIEFLEKKGYLLYADTNINSIFVKKDVWVNRK
jgi:FkbM family methyltransferase